MAGQRKRTNPDTNQNECEIDRRGVFVPSPFRMRALFVSRKTRSSPGQQNKTKQDFTSRVFSTKNIIQLPRTIDRQHNRHAREREREQIAHTTATTRSSSTTDATTRRQRAETRTATNGRVRESLLPRSRRVLGFHADGRHP